MFPFLTSLISPLASLGTSLTNLFIAKQQAKTDIEKAEIDAQIQQINSIKDVMVAEASRPISAAINTSIRAIAALGPVIYLSKIFIWDKVVGSFMNCASIYKNATGCETFTTDALNDPNLAWVIVAVIGFFFLTSRK